MPVTATAHLNFRGNAREALTFYQSVFGGQVMAATYSQVGVPQDSADRPGLLSARCRTDSCWNGRAALSLLELACAPNTGGGRTLATSARG